MCPASAQTRQFRAAPLPSLDGGGPCRGRCMRAASSVRGRSPFSFAEKPEAFPAFLRCFRGPAHPTWQLACRRLGLMAQRRASSTMS